MCTRDFYARAWDSRKINVTVTRWCQEHRSKLTTAATRVFWDKHKCTGMQTQNTNINTQTTGAHVYYGQICLFVWVACVSENTSNPLGCIDSWRLKRDRSENFDRLVRRRIGGARKCFCLVILQSRCRPPPVNPINPAHIPGNSATSISGTIAAYLVSFCSRDKNS